MMTQPTSMRQIVERYGEWTAMSVHLGDGEYTMNPPRSDRRLRRFLQTVADLARKPMDKLRVLDLACLEGQYAIEFARQGAQAVGIEIREANIEKARWAAHRLGLGNVEFHQDDVRNLSKDKYGTFDVVICAGILYHLSVPDVFEFVKRIYDVCNHLAIFDTLFSMRDTISVEYGGQRYWGLEYREHDEKATAEQKLKDVWASVDNTSSFWFTHASLCNLMAHTGFTSFLECHNPSLLEQNQDRRTYVATKGETVRVFTSPLTDTEVEVDVPERCPEQINEVNRMRSPLRRFLKQALPQPVKDVVKPWLRTIGVLEADPTPAWRKRQIAEEAKRSRST